MEMKNNGTEVPSNKVTEFYKYKKNDNYFLNSFLLLSALCLNNLFTRFSCLFRKMYLNEKKIHDF